MSGLQRRVLPLAELRADFQLSRAELRDAGRGADDADFEPLDTAAHQLAVAENIAVFNGWQGAFAGIDETSPHEPVALGNADRYPQAVAGAVERLLQSGVAGPYGLALGSEQFAQLRAKPGGEQVSVTIGDFADVPIPSTYRLIYVVWNTLSLQHPTAPGFRPAPRSRLLTRPSKRVAHRRTN